jgi:hypothetical protein
MGRWAERARQLQRESNLKVAEDIVSFKPGMRVQYRIPVIKSPKDYEWECHRGRIELVDEDWQMVLVLPETEDQPWRWVNLTYIKKGTL